MNDRSPRPLLRGALLATSAAWLSAFTLLPAPGLVAEVSAQSPEERAQAFRAEVQTHLDRAQQILDRLLAVEGPRTVENTLEPLNDLSIELDRAGSLASLTENVHPDPDVRQVAEKASQDVQAFVTQLSLNRGAYDALKAVDVSRTDAVTRRFHEHTLRDYRRAGVDKDEATREKVRALREELVEIGQEFDRNIREGRRWIELDDVAQLDGLPKDYIDAHQPGKDGKIRITTDYPDLIPVMTYAKDPTVRERLYREFNNRAYPENEEVLQRLMAKRNELAQLLGYRSWAQYITEDKMAKSPANVAEFVRKLDEASKKRARADYAMLLERKRTDDPKATAVEDWEKAYYQDLVKNERFAFDSQVLRSYYNYPQVKDGILGLTERLFSVDIRPLAGVPVWHPDVEAYELYEGDRLIGRFYLDMHPREGKYSHAAQFPYKVGIRDRQVPEAVLVCNFPKPDENGLALMPHDDVETFLHEFGHLLHTMFGGHQRWADQSGIATEWDFAEAPSQMLEEWALDPATLQTFATHHETGEPIPADLVEKLRAANDFGRGLWVRQQTFYTAVSLHCYDRDPAKAQLSKLVPELQAKYSPFRHVPDTHMYASFAHLEGYSVMYYTYLWSLVMAKDMFSKFDGHDLLNPAIATEYRRTVLEPGGTRDAADLVADFLGRPYGFESFEKWLSGGATELSKN